MYRKSFSFTQAIQLCQYKGISVFLYVSYQGVNRVGLWAKHMCAFQFSSVFCKFISRACVMSLGVKRVCDFYYKRGKRRKCGLEGERTLFPNIVGVGEIIRRNVHRR